MKENNLPELPKPDVTFADHSYPAYSASAVQAYALSAIAADRAKREGMSDEVVAWLNEAAEDIESWGAYASEYFQNKWDLTGDAQKYRDRADQLSRALLAHAPQVSEGFVLIPMVPNVEMREVMYEDSWLWEDLLAAAGAITEDQYAELSAAPQPEQKEG